MSQHGCVRLASVLALAALVLGSPVWGQSGSETIADFGALGQGVGTYVNTDAAFMGAYLGDSVAVGPNACVPTAVINGLTYLQQYQLLTYANDPFTTSPDAAAQVNAMAQSMKTFNTTRAGANGWTNVGGSLVPSAFNGLKSYLTANPAPTVGIKGQVAPATPAGWSAKSLSDATLDPYVAGTNVAGATPTAQFLADALNENDGVEIGIEWGSYSGATFTGRGGHFLTLQAINMTGGSGTISFFDPWGLGTGSPANTNALVNATVALTNGFLYVTYPTDLAGSSDDPTDSGPLDSDFPQQMLGWDGQTGRIDVAMVEFVPEPTALAMMPLLALIVRRRRR